MHAFIFTAHSCPPIFAVGTAQDASRYLHHLNRWRAVNRFDVRRLTRKPKSAIDLAAELDKLRGA